MANDARARMEALVKAQSSAKLIGSWKIAAEQLAGADDFAALLLTMTVIEWELVERGVPYCDDCSGPDGNHVPELCEQMRAVSA